MEKLKCSKENFVYGCGLFSVTLKEGKGSFSFVKTGSILQT